MDAVKALRKELKKRSTFENGTVIKWVGGGKYTYVALFVAETGLWYLTSTFYGSRSMRTETMMEILSGADVSDVEVATAWDKV